MPTAFLNFNDLSTYANAAALAAAASSALSNGTYAEVTGLGVFQLNKDSQAIVDNVTVIMALNGGRWLYNNFLHIQENAEAIIDGSQIGSFSNVEVTDGSNAGPTYTFINDPDSGFFLVADAQVGVTIEGTLVNTWTATAQVFAPAIQLSADAGSAAAPTYTFTGDLDTGAYHVGANQYGIAVAGAVVTTTTATAWILATGTQMSVPVGTAAAPPYSFTGDLDTGLYHAAANRLGLSVNGAVVVTVDATAVTIASGAQLLMPASTAAAPAFALGGEQTGDYLISAGNYGISIAGVLKATLSATVFTLVTGIQLNVAVASAAAPSYTWTGDLDTGFYNAAANTIGMAVNGAVAATLSATALNMATGVALQINAVQVVGARNTGWTTFAGTGTKNQGAINVDTFTATDANIRLLGQGVKGILDALILHGLLGA